VGHQDLQRQFAPDLHDSDRLRPVQKPRDGDHRGDPEGGRAQAKQILVPGGVGQRREQGQAQRPQPTTHARRAGASAAASGRAATIPRAKNSHEPATR